MVSSDVVFLGSMLSQAKHFLCSKQEVSFVPRKIIPVFHAKHFLWSRQSISCVPGETFPLFQTKLFLCSTHDSSCVPRKAFPVFQAGHFLCSKQRNSCVPRKTFPVFHARHFLCSTQDASCIPSRTFPVFQPGHVLSSTHEKMFQLQTYWSYPLKFVIFRAGFFEAHDAMVSSDVVFLGSVLAPHRDVRFCKTFKRPKNREDSSDFDDFLTKSIATTQFCFSKILRRWKFCEIKFLPPQRGAIF